MNKRGLQIIATCIAFVSLFSTQVVSMEPSPEMKQLLLNGTDEQKRAVVASTTAAICAMRYASAKTFIGAQEGASGLEPFDQLEDGRQVFTDADTGLFVVLGSEICKFQIRGNNAPATARMTAGFFEKFAKDVHPLRIQDNVIFTFAKINDEQFRLLFTNETLIGTELDAVGVEISPYQSQ